MVVTLSYAKSIYFEKQALKYKNPHPNPSPKERGFILFLAKKISRERSSLSLGEGRCPKDRGVRTHLNSIIRLSLISGINGRVWRINWLLCLNGFYFRGKYLTF